MPLTYVWQASRSITPVKTLAERVAAVRLELKLSQTELAARASCSSGAIGNIESGTRLAPRNLLEIAAALNVSPTWLKTGRGPRSPLPRGREDALAHDMSLARNTLSLPKVTWEQLMDADLNEPFELEVIDDALGPDIFKGCTVRLDPGRPPQAGRPVLVKDGAGRIYLRDYQVAGAGRWQAVARQRGYAPLDSEADGLQLVAVMRGFDWP